jgi:hypothetical protein
MTVEGKFLADERIVDAGPNAGVEKIARGFGVEIGEAPAQLRDGLAWLRGKVALVAQGVPKLAEEKNPHLALSVAASAPRIVRFLSAHN